MTTTEDAITLEKFFTRHDAMSAELSGPGIGMDALRGAVYRLHGSARSRSDAT